VSHGMSNLVLVGLNHRTADVAVRERLAIQTGALPEALKQLAARPGMQEVLIFSTCNRVELLACADIADEGFRTTEEFLCQSGGMNPAEIQGKLYRLSDATAVRHVFRVASSLDSMILGEPQILGQVKSFYGIATKAGTIGPFLNALLQASFHAAKRVRKETNIGEYPVSVSSAAVELARKIFGESEGGRVVLPTKRVPDPFAQPVGGLGAADEREEEGRCAPQLHRHSLRGPMPSVKS